MDTHPAVPLTNYREKSPGLRREFELHTDKVHIRGKMQGNPFATVVPLEQMHPEYGFTWGRPRRPYVALVAALFFAAVAVVYVKVFEMSLWSIPVAIVLLISVLAAAATVYCLPRVRTFSFVNTSGVVVLTVIESGPERERAEEFVRSVAAAIVTLRHGAHATRGERTSESKLSAAGSSVAE